MITPLQPRPNPPDWFYARDDGEFGPTDLSGLQAMANSRHLLPACEVWQFGSPVRTAAATVQGLLFPEPAVPPVPDTRNPPRGFYRSTDDRLVFGLCGGLAHQWGLPTALVRVVMVGLLACMVGWAYVFSALLPAVPTRSPRAPRGGVA
jgi:phage shock protein PspC (stress-responsive transcriptional regulator)